MTIVKNFESAYNPNVKLKQIVANITLTHFYPEQPYLKGQRRNWTKIKNNLGYFPEVKFEVGIQNTVNWYRLNEFWWKPLKSR